MPEAPSFIASTLMLILPLPLIAVGLGIGLGAYRYARWMRTLTKGSAWFALMGAVLAAGTYFLGMSDSKTYFSTHLPMRLGQIALSVDVNSLTVLMLLLVAFVGMVVTRFSYTYLNGDSREGQFHRWLSFVLGSFLMLISSGNTWEFLIFWVATSLGLHQLLVFYRERPIAVLAARKKYLLHRVADVGLFVAFVLIVRTLHTSQLARIGPALAGTHGLLPEPLQIASGLLVVSAVLKSAQFPFHGWLIQVMEAPTPVSALLHAGIIYTGTFLLLRMVPLMSRVMWTGDALIVMGLVSIVAASLMMTTMTNIKGSLAYSTSAQMGFMLMECGLGLYSLALLHIVSHSVYKAHAFLSSGSAVDHFRVPQAPTEPGAATMGKAIGSLAIAIPVVTGIGIIFGVPLRQQISLTVMGIILAVAISQLLLQALNLAPRGVNGFLWITISFSALISTAYFGLDILFAQLSVGVLPTARESAGFVHDGLFGLIVGVFVGLLFGQQMLPRIRQHPLGQAIYVHLYNDLYLDMVFTRFIRRFWPGHTDESSLQSAVEDPLWEAIS